MIDIVPVEENKSESPANSICIVDNILTATFESDARRLITPITVSDSKGSQYHAYAVWDTGAMNSCISENLASGMKLERVDVTTLVTTAGAKETACGIVDVKISDDILFKNIKVTFTDMSRHKADFIIGMDIISRGKLEVYPENGEIILKFSKISN